MFGRKKRQTDPVLLKILDELSNDVRQMHTTLENLTRPSTSTPIAGKDLAEGHHPSSPPKTSSLHVESLSVINSIPFTLKNQKQTHEEVVVNTRKQMRHFFGLVQSRHVENKPKEISSSETPLPPSVNLISEVLNQRQADLLTERYRINYTTIKIDQRSIVINSYLDAGLKKYITSINGRIEIFLTTIKPGICILSAWISIDDFVQAKISAMDKPLLATALLRASSITLTLKPSQMTISQNAKMQARLAWNDIQESTEQDLFTIYESYARFAAALLERNMFHKLYSLVSGHLQQRRMLDQSLSSMVSAVMVALVRPFPEGYEDGRSLEQCKTDYDWHCEAVAFLADLPYPPEEYHADYLHESLGLDLMDLKSGHYFIAPRRILAFFDAHDTIPVKLNLQSWSQQLAETISSQLYLLHAMDFELIKSIRFARNNNFNLFRILARRNVLSLSKILERQRKMQSDLEEFFAVSVATNPVYIEHMEVVKKVNRLEELYSSIKAKIDVLQSTLSLEEQRLFIRAAQILAVISGSLGISNIIATVLVAQNKFKLEELIQVISLGFLLSFLLILLVVLWIGGRRR